MKTISTDILSYISVLCAVLFSLIFIDNQLFAQTDLSISSITASPNPVNNGSNVTFTITATSSGSATNVTVTNVLPKDFTYVSGTPNCSNNRGTVQCLVGSLSGSAMVTIVAKPMLTVALPVTVKNVTGVVADQFDPNMANNSAIASVTVNSAPPNPPSNLTATAVSPTQINLSWTDNSNDETGFNIYVRIGANPPALLAQVPANSITYSHIGATQGATYYYTIRSVRSGVESPDSNEASATTPCGTLIQPSLTSPPNAATGVSRTPVLDWTDVQYATSYEVQVATDAAFTNIVRSANPVSSTWTVTPALNTGTTYYWRVRAKNCGPFSVWSSSRSFTTCSTLTAPSLLTPANGATNQPVATLLDWSDVTGASSYNIEVATDAGFTNILASGTSTTSNWTVSPSLFAGFTYHWRVRAVNSCSGPGIWSGSRSFSTCSEPAAANPITPNGSTGVGLTPNLDWNDVTGAISYEVQVSRYITFPTPVDREATGLTTSNWTVSPPLSPGTQYFWQVRAVNSCAPGPYGAKASFTTCTTPAGPPLVSPANGATNISMNALLDWSDVSGAISYDVQVATNSNFTTIVRSANGLTSSNWTVTPTLNSGTTYWWRVRLTNCNGGNWSSRNFTTEVNNSVFISQVVPPTMVAGQTYNISVAMKNTGTSTWTSANVYRLGTVTPTLWTSNGRVELSNSVAPNATHTFNFTVTAPSTAGTFNFQWRMVHEMVEWFGATTTNVAINVTAPVRAATFVSQSPPPTSMVPGQKQIVSVTMKNTGTSTWTIANLYRLGSQNPVNNTNWGIGRVELTTSVPPTATHTFTFTITAPSTAGVYNFQWQMLQEGIQWFGPLTPNVAVNVTQGPTGNNASFLSQSVPTFMVPGQPYNVSVTMQNIGTTTWTSAQFYRLGSQNPANNVVWGTGRVELTASVAPGQLVTFNFTVTAPSTTATYNFQWQMLQEGIQWFGPLTPNVAVTVSPAPAGNNAAFLSQMVPTSMVRGQSYSVSITMRNTGTSTWTTAQNYKLGSQNPANNLNWGTGRVELTSSVATYQQVTFNFNVTPPSTPGNYNFQWQMLQEGIQWFGSLTPNVVINVN